MSGRLILSGGKMVKQKNATTIHHAHNDGGQVEFGGSGDASPGVHDDLEASLRFETLIADLSLKFINLPSDEVDHEIEAAQRRVCEFVGLELSALWQWSAEAPGFLKLTHLYRSVDGAPTPDPMDARTHFPWCLEQLLAGEVIAVSSMEELPAGAAVDRETWHRFGIKTTLTIPLAAGGGPLIGALSFNDMRNERVWPEALVKRL
jgi:hypothetical protein